jgi:hypothetical protein
MTDIENHTEHDGEEGAPGDIRANLLAKLQEVHEEAKADHKLFLAIPSHKNLLWARFAPFPFDKTESKMAEFRKAQRQGQAVIFQAACDTLIDACEELMLLPEEFGGGTDKPDIGVDSEGKIDGHNLIPIDPDAPIPYKFDERLVGLFIKNNPGSARSVVRELFPTEQSVVNMNVRVSQWMQDVTRDVNDDVLGE